MSFSKLFGKLKTLQLNFKIITKFLLPQLATPSKCKPGYDPVYGYCSV